MYAIVMGFPGSSNSKDSAYNEGDPAWILGLERSPGEGNATSFNILAWRISCTKEAGWL